MTLWHMTLMTLWHCVGFQHDMTNTTEIHIGHKSSRWTVLTQGTRHIPHTNFQCHTLQFLHWNQKWVATIYLSPLKELFSSKERLQWAFLEFLISHHPDTTKISPWHKKWPPPRYQPDIKNSQHPDITLTSTKKAPPWHQKILITLTISHQPTSSPRLWS